MAHYYITNAVFADWKSISMLARRPLNRLAIYINILKGLMYIYILYIYR